MKHKSPFLAPIFAVALILGSSLAAIYADKRGVGADRVFKDNAPTVEPQAASESGKVADNLGKTIEAQVTEALAVAKIEKQADAVTDAILESVAPASAHCVVVYLESGEELRLVIPSIRDLVDVTPADFRDAIRERIREALHLGACSFDLHEIDVDR